MLDDNLSPSSLSDDTAFARQTLGSIAARVPGATSLFRSKQLDFCCHGEVSLQNAATAAGIDLSALLDELRTLAARMPSSSVPEETAALIDHILTRYHEVHRKELPELIRLARRVEQVHRGRPAAPVGLADALDTMLTELVAHMEKEEQVLFPMMKTNGCPMLAPPIARMRMEHEAHGDHLRLLRELTHDFVVPEHACASWRALYAGAEKLTADLMEHIHIENNVLFPRFDGSNHYRATN